MSISTLIQCGTPLMALGPHGCGKYQLCVQAIKHNGLVPWRIGAYDVGGIQGCKELIPMLKKVSGNSVIIFDDIEKCKPSLEEIILREMDHPDRPVIVCGVECKYPRIIKKCRNIVTMTKCSPDEFAEFGTLYKPIVTRND